ncbi:hypothetical protein K9B35_00575 [Sphingomonas sp. R647]|uniref:hypothetical protein n=1 Tax=Sphingomonas sp. R647 TaxID=2875233 RepID=UPI001CD4AC75|nr:hypothetical protein [Sphingomonas sp. R647]MCA1196450.1 hypothetical protein [Sphingomonas sp. R647]
MVHQIRVFLDRVLLGLVARTLGRHHRSALSALISCARSHYALVLFPLIYRAQLHWSRGDAEAADLLWQRLESAMPGSSLWPLARANAARLSGDLVAQGEILARAQARGVRDPMIEASIDSSRPGGKVAADARALIDETSTPPATVFQASIHLSADGQLTEARRGLDRLLSDPRLGWEAQVQLLALDLVERFGTVSTLPGWFSPKRGSALIRTDSDTLLVVFLQPGGTFGVSANAIHALLGAAPPNILYLYDSKALFHLAGTDRFGAGYREMIHGIRLCAAEIGAKRIMTFGRCAPGFTAIKAGLDLAAMRVIAISPVTTMVTSQMSEDARAPVLQRRLAEALSEHERDVLPQLMQQDRTSFDIFYNRAHRRDNDYAQRIAAAQRVSLYPLDEPDRRDPIERLLVPPLGRVSNRLDET